MISPAANGWIWNLPSVASATIFDKVSEAPQIVSSDFGKLDVHRHLSSGMDWAIAGLATAATANPAPATLSTSRRFISFLPFLECWRTRLADACLARMNTSGNPD